MNAMDLLGNSAGEIEAGTSEVVCSYILKDTRLRSPGVEVLRRSGVARTVRRGVQEAYDAGGIGVGEWLEQDRIDHGKDSGVGSDAQRQGHNSGHREGGARDQHAQGVFKVVAKIAHDLSRLQEE